MNQVERNAKFRNLLNQIEERQPSTKGDGDRVAVYAAAIAQHMGLAQDRLLILRFAAMIHAAETLAFGDPDKAAIETIIQNQGNPSGSVESRILEVAIAFNSTNAADSIAALRGEPARFLPETVDALEKVSPLIQPLSGVQTPNSRL